MIKKIIFLAIGTVCAILGVAGIILPLIPAIPLLLLAAIFYAKGSETARNWLHGHKFFGKYMKKT